MDADFEAALQPQPPQASATPASLGASYTVGTHTDAVSRGGLGLSKEGPFAEEEAHY